MTMLPMPESKQRNKLHINLINVSDSLPLFDICQDNCVLTCNQKQGGSHPCQLSGLTAQFLTAIHKLIIWTKY